MINTKTDYVAWAALVTELDGAREHLEQLSEKLAREVSAMKPNWLSIWATSTRI